MTDLHEQLQTDLARARKMAITASKSVKDVGSMSADSVFIPVGEAHRIKRSSKRLDEIVDGGRVNSRWWKGYLIPPPGDGVASKRLAAAEAMSRELHRRGWGAVTFYRGD